jgi:methyl-accepting chemotaxis protein
LARQSVIEAREMEIKHSRTDDKSYHGEYEEKIAGSTKAANDALAAYQAIAVGEEDAKLLATVNKGWADYQKFKKQVLALGREKKQVDAADLSDGAAAMALDETLGALAAITKYNFEGGNAAADDASATYKKARAVVSGLVLAALALGATMAVLLTRGIIGQLGGEPRAAVQLARAVAAGDLTTPIHVKPGDTTSLMASLKAMQDGLAQAVRQVREGSESVATASSQIADGNQDLSGRTEQQASALQQTAATMEQLGSTVRTNADNARQANQLAQGAATVATKGGNVVGQVVQTMKGINDSSRKIADIISVIDGIAFQTNILALNAAVEAARAGEQGRGFAVVASEVRSLAQRSAAAAREIKSLISASVERVETGTTLVDQAGHTMEEIVAAIGRVSAIVGEISSASSEQSNGVQQVSQAVTQMDQATQQNAALVEESAAAAESLKVQAQQLVQAVAVFRLA